MGLLDKFKKKAVVEPIQLHPDCRDHHVPVIKAWLDGHGIEALNPETKEWVCIDNPIFAPDVKYRVANSDAWANAPAQERKPHGGITTDTALEYVIGKEAAYATRYGSNEPLQALISQGKPWDAPAKPTVVKSVLKRGEVYKAVNGKHFIVLGDKADLLTDYEERDKNSQLIVARFDEGMKKTFGTRSVTGDARDHGASLSRLVTFKALPIITQTGGLVYLLERKNDWIILNKYTQEVQVVPK